METPYFAPRGHHGIVTLKHFHLCLGSTIIRLSQGTTGVLVLARTKQLARELSQQFRARAIDKSYLALVLHPDGDADARTRSFFPTKEGLIDASLSFEDGRVRVHVQTQAGGTCVGNGSGAVAQALPLADSELGLGSKAARTRWEVLASSVSH